jgi:chromosome segregation ATPase
LIDLTSSDIGQLHDRLLNLQRERLKEQSEYENVKKDMSSRIRFLEDTVTKLNDTMDNLQNKNSSMTEFVSNTKDHLDFLEKTKTDTDEEHRRTNNRIHQLERELKEEKARSISSEQFIRETEAFNEQIKRLRNENVQLQSQLNESKMVQEQQALLRERNQVLEDQVERGSEETDAHRRSFEKASYANEELRRENELLLQQVRKIQRDLDIEFERHEEKERILRDDLGTAAQSFELIQIDKAALFNEMRTTIDNLREENNQLSESLKKLTAEQVANHDELQKSAQRHQNDLHNLNRKLSQVQDELRETHSLNAKLNVQVQEKQKELAAKADKIVFLTEQFADMERQYKIQLVSAKIY